MTAVDHAELKRVAEVVSDEEIARVHGRANFGPTMTPRDVVNEGVLKYAIGYHSGHTQLCILLEHGLITKPRPGRYDASLTKKGKRYARALHEAGINLRSFRTQAPDSWRPIETAPKDGTPVYLFPSYSVATWDLGAQDWLLFVVPLNNDRTVADDWSVQPSLMYEVTGGLLGDEPTHWMPLPAAPALRPQTAESGT